MKNKELEQGLKQVKELKKALSAEKTEYDSGEYEVVRHSVDFEEEFEIRPASRWTEPDEEKRKKAREQLEGLVKEGKWYSVGYAAARALGESDAKIDRYLRNWVYSLDAILNCEGLLVAWTPKLSREEARQDLEKLYSTISIPSEHARRIAKSLGYSGLRRFFRFMEVDVI